MCKPPISASPFAFSFYIIVACFVCVSSISNLPLFIIAILTYAVKIYINVIGGKAF